MTSRARRKRTGTVAAALALGAGVLAADWKTPVAIPGYTGNFALGYPEVSVAPDHSIAVAWEENGGEPWVATRTGASGGWSALQVGPSFGYRPRIAMNAAGDLAVVWIGSDRISVRYRPAGGAWEPTALLELDPADVAARVAINAAGDVLVAWIGLDDLATQYEIHAAFRAKSGTWPATGSYELVGGPANLLGELDVALDDAGQGAVVWTTSYAVIGGESNNQLSVLRGATRAPGGPWSAPGDLSPRGEEGAIPCDENLPVPFPHAAAPRLGTDPASGAVVVAYAYDPTGVSREQADGEWHCSWYSPEDRGVTLGAGTTVALPSGGIPLGEWQVGAPRVALAGETVTVAWAHCEENGVVTCELGLHSGVGTLGSTPALSVDVVLDSGAIGAGAVGDFEVAASGVERGFLAHDYLASASGWEMEPGISSSPVALRDGLSGMGGDTVAVTATRPGHAVAVLLGSDRKVYVVETFLFRDGFESEDTGDWSSTVP